MSYLAVYRKYEYIGAIAAKNDGALYPIKDVAATDKDVIKNALAAASEALGGPELVLVNVTETISTVEL